MNDFFETWQTIYDSHISYYPGERVRRGRPPEGAKPSNSLTIGIVIVTLARNACLAPSGISTRYVGGRYSLSSKE